MIKRIWSDKAIDYSKGVDVGLYNRVLKKYIIYTKDEINKLPLVIKKQLLNIPRKIGCSVYTAEYCKYLLDKQGR